MSVFLWIIIIVVIVLAITVVYSVARRKVAEARWRSEEPDCRITVQPESKNELYEIVQGEQKFQAVVGWADLDGGTIYMDGFADFDDSLRALPFEERVLSLEENKTLAFRMLKYLALVKRYRKLKLHYESDDQPSEDLLAHFDDRLRSIGFARVESDRQNLVTWAKR